MIVQSLDSYMRTQGMTCALINIVLNPVVAWLGNRQMAFMPLWGRNSIVFDTAVTSIVFSLLVTLFTTSGVRQALLAGRIKTADGFPPAGYLLSRLPRQAWPLGLLLGLGMACVLAPLVFVMLHTLGYSGLPFAGFAFLKAMYTGPLGFVVTRWVVLRQVID